ncbi:MAG: recombinase family protein [Eubacteriales bacterium]
MNIVIYARYSSASQSEQSIEGQLKSCYDYAERSGYNVVGEYIDRALSGTDAEKRLEFQKMISDSAKRQFEGVLVYQLDRFARNRYDSATFKAKLKKNGVRVLSARENITDDASGVLMESILEGMAEYYSKELSQKVKRGMQINAEKRLSTGGALALGYKSVNKQIVLDEETAPIVQKIFSMYIEGKTMASIIAHLNAIGLKTSRGNPYNKNSIRNILVNRRYMGIYIYNDVEIPDGIPRIIEDKTFEQAQSKMAENKKAPARAKAKEEMYLLTTKLFCGSCDSAMIGISGTSHTNKLYQYYSCVNQRKKQGCQMKPVAKDLIENVVVDSVRATLTPEYIQEIAQKIADLSLKEGNTDQLNYIQAKIKENEKATQNLVKAIEQGTAIELLSAQIQKRQEEKELLEVELAKEKIQSPQLTAKEIAFFMDKFRVGDVRDVHYRTNLIDTFVRKILLFDDESGTYVDIYCSASPNGMKIPLGNPKGSPKGHLVRLTGVEPVHP